MQFEGGVTETKKLPCVVSQESLISPLLFLLYKVELTHSGPDMQTILVFWGFGRVVAKSAVCARREVDLVLSRARENAVSYHTNKSEVA